MSKFVQLENGSYINTISGFRIKKSEKRYDNYKTVSQWCVLLFYAGSVKPIEYCYRSEKERDEVFNSIIDS